MIIAEAAALFGALTALAGPHSWVTGTLSSAIPVPEEFRPNGRVDHFALLIGAHGELRHQGNLSMAYQVLLEQGYKRESVYILDSNEPSPYYPHTGVTKHDTMRTLFRNLAFAIEPHDTFFLYVTGHGRRIEADGAVVSTMVLNEDEDLAREEFLALLEGIEPATGIAFVDICYWGSFEVESWKSGVFISVARPDRTSYGTTFPRAFWAAFRDLRAPTLRAAFDAALANDAGTKKKLNQPAMKTRGLDAAAFSILGR